MSQPLSREADALVPEELLRVQWTRLNRGIPTAEFVESIRRLLANPRQAASTLRERAADPVKSAALQPSRRRSLWPVVAGLAVLILAAGAFLALRRGGSSGTASPVAAKIEDKSLAVLPFENMSEDKDNAFFTDGIHEDILTNLAQIHDLRVVSRTSVMQYKDTKKTVREIAAELGVAYILEGSVRRSGNKVRVTGQLIHAASDEHVWAHAYDRDLTDIFGIQGQLAEAIAAALQSQLSPNEKKRITRWPTGNPVAYDLYLQAREARNRGGNSLANLAKQIEFLKASVAQDPQYGAAWGELADAYVFGVFSERAGKAELLAQGKAAIEQAQKLAPEDPDVQRSVGTYYYYGFRDYARAKAIYGQLAKLSPNDPTLFDALALIERRQGHWAESAGNGRRAVELDPANVRYLRNLLSTLQHTNHYDEAERVGRRVVALVPDSIMDGYFEACLPFEATGSTAEVEAYLAHLTLEESESPEGIDVRRDWAVTLGKWTEALRIDAEHPGTPSSLMTRPQFEVQMAGVLYGAGDLAGMAARLKAPLEELRASLQKEPGNTHNLLSVAFGEVLLGHREEALKLADEAVRIVPESLDALDGPAIAGWRTEIYDLAGETETALSEYQRLLHLPSMLNVHQLKYSLTRLHGNLRFEAMIANPANNAPLF